MEPDGGPKTEFITPRHERAAQTSQNEIPSDDVVVTTNRITMYDCLFYYTCVYYYT